MDSEHPAPRFMVEAAEYDGESSVDVAATQLGITRSRANRVVDGWIDLFAQGPTPIRDLRFVSRTPARLFDALRSQTQLRTLELTWGDYADLTVLEGMERLEELTLGGASAVTSLEPLSRLRHLTSLTVEGTKRVSDYSPLRHLESLEEVSLGPGINGPWMHADSIDFVRHLPRLRVASLNLIVDSDDFTPVLDLRHVELIHLHPTRRMRPTMVDLEWNVPGVARGVEHEAGSLNFVKLEPGDPRADAHAPRVPEVEEELALANRIDFHWGSLLQGRESRIQVIRWTRECREALGWVDLLEVTRSGLERLEDLVGERWDLPDDPARRLLTADLELWRARVAGFRADPHGEKRRDSVRALTLLRDVDPDIARRAARRMLELGDIRSTDAAGFDADSTETG